MKTLHDYNYIADAGGWIFTAMQTERTLQIISIVLVCLSTAVSLAYNLYKWWKEAKSDGQITKEEIKDGIGIIKDGANKLNEHLHKIDDIKKNQKEE